MKNNFNSEQTDYTSLVHTVLSTRYPAISPKAFVHTYGCQGNVAESEVIKGILESVGYEMTDNIDEANLILYNTCAIREHAEDRVFGNVGQLKAKKESDSDLIIALCGCMMQQERVSQRIQKSFPYVDIVFGTHVAHKLPQFLYRVLCTGKRVFDISDGESGVKEGLPIKRDGTIKAWVPIMYGCDNFCSYCIVPYVKGRERSRDFDTIIDECKQLVKAGYKEITLLGQNVNSFNRKLPKEKQFPALLEAINAIEGDFIIRFMTSHPKDCSRQLLETMSRCKKVAKHLHLPVQCGSDRVLEQMNRHYDRKKYLELIDYAYKLMPELSITSDIIVGFPTETYSEFKDTLSLLEYVKYTSLFTFIYSPRPGTKAAEMPDPISRKEKGQWFSELLALQEQIAAKRTANMVGKQYRALIEGKSKNSSLLAARNEGNMIIEVEGDESLIGTFQTLEVTSAKTWVLSGKIIK